MRKAALSFVVLAIILLALVFYPQAVEKPVKDGEGPLAIYLDPSLPAPEYHSPLEWWKLNHKNVVNRGDLLQADCLYCHDPVTSCNNCHNYVGIAEPPKEGFG